MLKRILFSLLFIITLSIVTTNAQSLIATNINKTVEHKPISYGLLIDRSVSQRDNFNYVIAGAKEIIANTSPKDEAFLVEFSNTNDIELTVELTQNKTELLQRLTSVESYGTGTAILDAVAVSAEYLREKRKDHTGALILITDGRDEQSAYKLPQLTAKLQTAQIPLYVLVLVKQSNDKVEKKRAQQSIKFAEELASKTNGKAFIVSQPELLNQQVTALLQHLNW